jgi:hypothetical protein
LDQIPIILDLFLAGYLPDAIEVGLIDYFSMGYTRSKGVTGAVWSKTSPYLWLSLQYKRFISIPVFAVAILWLSPEMINSKIPGTAVPCRQGRRCCSHLQRLRQL